MRDCVGEPDSKEGSWCNQCNNPLALETISSKYLILCVEPLLAILILRRSYCGVSATIVLAPVAIS